MRNKIQDVSFAIGFLVVLFGAACMDSPNIFYPILICIIGLSIIGIGQIILLVFDFTEEYREFKEFVRLKEKRDNQHTDQSTQEISQNQK